MAVIIKQTELFWIILWTNDRVASWAKSHVYICTYMYMYKEKHLKPTCTCTCKWAQGDMYNVHVYKQ